MTHPAAHELRVVDAHPALGALRASGIDPGSRAGVVTLSDRRKSSVYRVVATRGPVIVKRYRLPSGSDVERGLYATVLPALGVSAPRLLGWSADAGGTHAWLVLEDAGNEPYTPTHEPHLRAAAGWLGRLHSRAHADAQSRRLPRRSVDEYLRHLRSARERLDTWLSLSEADPALPKSIRERCDRVEEQWPIVEELCTELPETLVHGDFVPKNIGVTRRGGAVVLLPYDWEMAGWGVPAADLVHLARHGGPREFEAYGAHVVDAWPGVDVDVLRRAARVGVVFRLLASIDWATESLHPVWYEKPLAKLRSYHDHLATALLAVDLAE